MNKKAKGIFFIVLSAFCFSFMNMFVRMTGPDIPPLQKSFFRNFIAFFFSLGILLKSGYGFKWKKGNLPYLFGRSLFGTLGLTFNFYAVDHLLLSDATFLNKMSPFFVIIFSYLFLKEKIKPYQAICVIAAFIGSLFVIKPSFANADLTASLIGLAGGLCAGTAYTFVRMLTLRGEKSATVVFWFSSFSCLLLLPFFVFHHTPMTFGQYGLMLLAGGAATCGQFAITTAYSYAPAKEISIYDYSQILFSALLGWIMFGQIPDGWSLLGYFIIVLMAFLMFYLNQTHEK